MGDHDQITREALERYQAHLFHYRKRNGEPLAANTRVARLDPLKAFCKWLARTGQIASNPAADLVMPRAPRRLPGRVLTVSEMDRVFQLPDLGTPGGIRDRAILETLYSTGIRRLELVRLRLADVMPEREMLFVRSGKGGPRPVGATGESSERLGLALPGRSTRDTRKPA